MKTVLVLCLINLIRTCPSEMFCASCTLYNDQHFCSKCFRSIYNPNMKRCILPKNDKLVKNCAEYATYPSEKCTRCEYGYYLLNEKCVGCTVENCAICEGEFCNACFKGMTIDSKGQCSPAPCTDPNCDICDST